MNGKTPAEASGIQVEGENKFLTLIQNASQGPAMNRIGVTVYAVRRSGDVIPLY
ncbi:MAG TPA: hypothetical protein VNE86_00450 [Nitrososphaerales archaeon]|nr:hypothetical protein [Nitrososphaerales archaeon]